MPRDWLERMCALSLRPCTLHLATSSSEHNIDPPALRCTAAVDRLIKKTILRDGWLEFNVSFQHKYIRDERSGMESYPYPVKEG